MRRCHQNLRLYVKFQVALVTARYLAVPIQFGESEAWRPPRAAWLLPLQC
jgi:hypothetical protein